MHVACASGRTHILPTMQQMLQDIKNDTNKSEKVQLAVFDFDGTSISGNSPVILVRYLLSHELISKRIVLRILLWATAYKLRLPQNESWVRGLVFTAFKGKQKEEVDVFLQQFYDKEISHRFRSKAHQTMKAHQDAGNIVVVVSASFEPIIKRAMDFHPINFQISTRMCVDSKGAYTCMVDGLPIEGVEKVHAIKRFADDTYGKDNWELSYAYGDHHSDRDLLDAANHAYAIDPDQPLKRTVSKKGWDTLDWDE